MNTNTKTAGILEDVKVNVKVKIAGLWVAVMFLYIYVDYIALYMPGNIEEMIAGKMGPFPATQVALLAGMTLMTIPSVMVFLSLTLKANANRWTNIIVGVLHIVLALVNVIGESWAFYIYGTIVEIVFLSLIVWHAWKWPKQEA
jgi:uncharacterized membrane protein HdeD (DUF308 family)